VLSEEEEGREEEKKWKGSRRRGRKRKKKSQRFFVVSERPKEKKKKQRTKAEKKKVVLIWFILRQSDKEIDAQSPCGVICRQTLDTIILCFCTPSAVYYYLYYLLPLLAAFTISPLPSRVHRR
jgi:hypothetical protein